MRHWKRCSTFFSFPFGVISRYNVLINGVDSDVCLGGGKTLWVSLAYSTHIMIFLTMLLVSHCYVSCLTLLVNHVSRVYTLNFNHMAGWFQDVCLLFHYQGDGQQKMIPRQKAATSLSLYIANISVRLIFRRTSFILSLVRNSSFINVHGTIPDSGPKSKESPEGHYGRWYLRSNSRKHGDQVSILSFAF